MFQNKRTNLSIPKTSDFDTRIRGYKATEKSASRRKNSCVAVPMQYRVNKLFALIIFKAILNLSTLIRINLERNFYYGYQIFYKVNNILSNRITAYVLSR